MSKRKDSASERVRRAKAQPLFIAPGGDWSQCPADLRALEAGRATMINVLDKDASLLRIAFADHGLDPLNPWHWRGLLMTLAAAHYGLNPGRGRPEKWNPGAKDRLAADYGAAVRALRRQGRKPTKPAAVAHMKAAHPGRYPQTPKTLVTYLRKAGLKPD